jgi:hypothetical protein
MSISSLKWQRAAKEKKYLLICSRMVDTHFSLLDQFPYGHTVLHLPRSSAHH